LGAKPKSKAKTAITETPVENTVEKNLNESVNISMDWNTKGSDYSGSHQFVVSGVFIHEDDYKGPNDYTKSELRNLEPKHGANEDLEAGESTTTTWSVREVEKGTCDTSNPEVNLFNKQGYYHMGLRIWMSRKSNTGCPYGEALSGSLASTGWLKNVVKVTRGYVAQPKAVKVDGTSIWVK